MDYKRLYDAVNAEFDAEIALAVVQIVTINLTIKVKKKDFLTEGSLRERILKKAKKLLWQLDDDTFDLAVKIFDVYPSWNTRQEMHGLGGCTVKSFKELLGDDEYIEVSH